MEGRIEGRIDVATCECIPQPPCRFAPAQETRHGADVFNHTCTLEIAALTNGRNHRPSCRRLSAVWIR